MFFFENRFQIRLPESAVMGFIQANIIGMIVKLWMYLPVFRSRWLPFGCVLDENDWPMLFLKDGYGSIDDWNGCLKSR
jgi:hypothetical protein